MCICIRFLQAQDHGQNFETSSVNSKTNLLRALSSTTQQNIILWLTGGGSDSLTLIEKIEKDWMGFSGQMSVPWTVSSPFRSEKCNLPFFLSVMHFGEWHADCLTAWAWKDSLIPFTSVLTRCNFNISMFSEYFTDFKH